MRELNRKILALIAGFFVFSLAAYAETSAEDILRKAQERANQINEYRALLNSPDQNIRVAGLDVMLKSDDPAMREIAFNIAFSSADDSMRAIALRNKLLYLKVLNVELSERENATESEKAAVKDVFANTYQLKIKDYDAESGVIGFVSSYQSGQVNGTGLDFSDTYTKCHGGMTLGDGAELVGTLNCTYSKRKGSYNLKLRLQ